jgi:hypothetical protein
MFYFNLRSFSRLATVSLILTGPIAALAPARGSEASAHQDKLNGGYYLLDHVAEDETQLPLIFVVKTAPPELKNYADQISRTAKETVAAIKKMQDGDASLQFDRNPLPAIERDTRDSIKADKQHQLLFGATGSEFVRALLVSQIEASTYASNLAKVLAGQEDDPGRIKTLQHLSAQWLVRRNEAFRLLRDY